MTALKTNRIRNIEVRVIITEPLQATQIVSTLMLPLTQFLQLLPNAVCKLSAILQGNLWQEGPTATQQQQCLIATGITYKRKIAQVEAKRRLDQSLCIHFLDYSCACLPVLQISWKIRSSRVLVMRPVLLTELSSLARAQSNSCACLERTATLTSFFCSVATAYVRTHPTTYGHTCL